MKTNIAIFLVVIGLASCTEVPAPGKGGYTSGFLKIGVDNSFEPLMETEIYTYTSLNADAKMKATNLPEADIFDLLLKDSVQAAVTGRALNAEEMAYFKSMDKMPESILFAYDAVALVVNPANMDTTLTLDQVSAIFQGTITKWNEVNKASKLDGINVVFDNNKSSNASYIREKFLAGKEFAPNCFAVQTNEEVINYVNQNKNAVGVISLNWISDNVDKTAQKFLEKIKVVGIINPANTTKPEMARRPLQAYVWDKSYPLTREVYYIRTGLSASLGTGFANHLLAEKGQLIIDRIGMVPTTPTTRIVKIAE